MITVREIIHKIQPSQIMSMLGVGQKAISWARVNNSMPAAWYRQIKARCDELGIECPMELFNFKEPAEPEEVSE